MQNLLVSICCITYNHEKFIRDALEGILMQKTNFDHEIIVANDCSPDNTDNIVKEYISNHPKGISIKYFRHEKNIGVIPNFIFALNQCTGKYIALCEGDDYWTDPYKLQKQVDFLELNPEYVITYHNAKIIDAEGILIKESKLPLHYQRDYSNIELKKGSPILTLTMLFRNVMKNFPKEYNNVGNGDTFLICILGQFGKGKYMNNISPAAYRLHSGGIWGLKTNSEKYVLMLKTYQTLYHYFIKQNDYEVAMFHKHNYYKYLLSFTKNAFKIINISEILKACGLICGNLLKFSFYQHVYTYIKTNKGSE